MCHQRYTDSLAITRGVCVCVVCGHQEFFSGGCLQGGTEHSNISMDGGVPDADVLAGNVRGDEGGAAVDVASAVANLSPAREDGLVMAEGVETAGIGLHRDRSEIELTYEVKRVIDGSFKVCSGCSFACASSLTRPGLDVLSSRLFFGSECG